jgi:hypothetical protein
MHRNITNDMDGTGMADKASALPLQPNAIGRVVRWLIRAKLEFELSHYHRIADSLRVQIANDVDALVYANARCDAVRSRLLEMDQ